MDVNLIIAVAIGVVICIVVTAITKVFNKDDKVQDIVDLIADAIPFLLDTAEKITGTVAPETVDKLAKAKEIVLAAVQAVEKLSENEYMTSEEKKDLAIEYYKQIAKETGMQELTELQMKTLEILIENSVFEIDKLADKLPILQPDNSIPVVDDNAPEEL